MEILKLIQEIKKPMNLQVGGKGDWVIDFTNAKITQGLFYIIMFLKKKQIKLIFIKRQSRQARINAGN